MNKKLLAILVAVALCLALPTAALAGGGSKPPPTGGGTITGVVKNLNTGAVISGVTISNGSISGVTNASGVFTLSAVPAGAQTLSATGSGLQQTWQICTVVANQTTTVNWALLPAYPTNAMPAQTNGLVVLAWNDLGMHCDQDIYKYMCVLPPYNTLHVQIKDQNNKTGVMPTGLTVSYSFAKKTNSAAHTDFWTYAPKFGWNVPANIGIDGKTGLSGTMVADAAKKSWVAEGIPITPYDDDGTWDPYGAATITVKNSSGTVVSTQYVVAPVSTEMNCNNAGCHAVTNWALDILTKHDAANGTTLVADANAGTPHLCSECHADNALGKPGKTGVEALSYAMHKHHDGKVANTTAGCFNCHPGTKTQCLRGIMSRAGKGCPDCHGSINKMWTSQDAGRKPWLQEPRCADCHDAKHAENASTLYRNSILLSSANSGMNNVLYCEACHNSTHAEFTTSNSADAAITQKIQGNNYWIYACAACHPGKTVSAMHR